MVPKLALRAWRSNRKKRVEQRRPALGQRAFEREQPAPGNRAAIHAKTIRLAVGGKHAMTGHEDREGVSPDRMGGAGRTKPFREFGEGDGFATRDGARVLIDAAIERRHAVHIEHHIGEIAGFPAQQRRNAVDRDFGIQRGTQFAGVGILAQHAPPGLHLARFRKLNAENPGSVPCDAAPADRRIEYAVSPPRHSVRHPEGIIALS
jgi:hypothetical protein